MAMKDRFDINENAVSPVVGVMLMLVVTIIVAAVVSGFAGGLAETSQKAPQVTLSAEAHNDNYILIEHRGGDPLATETLKVRTFIPAGTFKDMNHAISDWGKQIYCPTNEAIDGGGYNWVTFQPGNQIKINWTDAFAPSSYGGYMAPGPGERVNIEIYDATSGKLIVTAQTIVLP